MGPVDILIADGQISAIGGGIEAPEGAQVIDARGLLAVPGLVSTHHHMFQCLTRARGYDHGLFGWLDSLWPLWERHDAEWQYAATLVAGAELLLSGCTTAFDHHYLPPNRGDDPIEAQAEAATLLGLRIVQGIGSMDVDAEAGGLAPASLCEDYARYVERVEAVARRAHDPAPGAMRQIAVAPCHPLAVTPSLVEASVDLARRMGLGLHTHLAEAPGEEAATVAATGLRPADLLASWGFLGPDVWVAHAVQLSDADITMLAATRTSVASCPSSNLRLGSGIARLRDMLDAGVNVSLGVDGTASNDVGSALAEMRMMLLASRAGGIETGLSPRECLDIATVGGARALGREDLGSLSPGSRADIALFDLGGLASIGTEGQPVAALTLAPPDRATHVLVEGRQVVRDGKLTGISQDEVVDTARRVIARWS